MTTLTITDFLKYADLQMAAEAFLRNEDTKELASTGKEVIDTLTEGNHHASKFTETQATAFADQWEVVDQIANTGTGFSGTLFRARKDDLSKGIKAGDLTISFRSTEFIDDDVRDSLATNNMEIFDTGFAWGQINDMEKWYAGLLEGKSSTDEPLTSSGQPWSLTGQHISVTGYSLGGHLATTFNLLHNDTGLIDNVVTFNGAGVGEVVEGGLQWTNDYFTDLIAHHEKSATPSHGYTMSIAACDISMGSDTIDLMPAAPAMNQTK
jgi:hypothetical protein